MITRAFACMLLATLILGGFSACKKDAPDSLYDPNYVSGAQPVVTKIDPAEALAGVTVLTITGSNFVPDPNKNLVFFDQVSVPVTAATATQLTVKAPGLPKDSIKVKVAAVGADKYSAPYLYKLSSASFDWGKLKPGELPGGIECDKDGNVYYSMIPANADTNGTGVRIITPAGVQSQYSPSFSGTVPYWRNMKFGPAGALFCVTSRQIIFRIPAGGGAPTIWTSTGLTPLNDLDFDQQGNIWAGGTGNAFYRIRTTDKNAKSFPFAGLIRAVRVYNGYLYVGGKRDSLEKVWRFPIVSADAVGPEEEYFNLSSVYGANTYGVNAITFSSDGDLYVGTDGPDGILIVHPTKVSEPMYPGIVQPVAVSLTWGIGTDMYEARTGTTPLVVKLSPLKTGAPYYGRTLP